MEFENKYPELFNEVIWPWGPTRAKFILLDELPASQLISNVNIVPQVGDSWLMFQGEDLFWDVPGGTLEEGENFVDTLQRELVEEVGAKLMTYSVFGAWRCYSLASKPYRPHLPHPEHYRIVGVGRVKVIRAPTNPPDGEKTLAVATVALREAVQHFEASGRFDLSQLYQLASEIMHSGKGMLINVV